MAEWQPNGPAKYLSHQLVCLVRRSATTRRSSSEAQARRLFGSLALQLSGCLGARTSCWSREHVTGVARRCSDAASFAWGAEWPRRAQTLAECIQPAATNVNLLFLASRARPRQDGRGTRNHLLAALALPAATIWKPSRWAAAGSGGRHKVAPAPLAAATSIVRQLVNHRQPWRSGDAQARPHTHNNWRYSPPAPIASSC